LQEFTGLSTAWRRAAPRLCVLLRLAALLHRSRSPTAKPYPMLTAKEERLSLRFPPGWLEDHPLTQLELEEEAQRLTVAGISLVFA